MKSAAQEATSMLIVRDIFAGIQGHFKARMTEWIMAFPTGAIALGFLVQPDMFLRPPAHHHAIWADETVWLWMIIVCFIARVVALIVNGTFKSFRHSPHLRTIASVICFNFWAGLSGTFLTSFLVSQGSFFTVPACLTLCMIEGLNIFRGTTDIAHQHMGLKRAGKWRSRTF